MRKIVLSTLLASMFAVTTATAVEVTQEQKITGLYVSFFKRAADKSGLDYWKGKSDDVLSRGENVSNVLKELSKGFAGHEVFVSTYSAMDNQAFVEAIYQNSLGKAGDSDGISYWVGLLNSGMSRSDMVAEFIESSLSTDLTTENYPTLSAEALALAQKRQNLISNKVNVALDFTHDLGTLTNLAGVVETEDDPAYIASMKIIQGVTEDESTLLKAKDYLDTIISDSGAIGKINDSFKWLNDITVGANQSKTCTKTTPFKVNPNGNPMVTFSTDGDSGETTVSVESGSVTLANCSVR
jgi:hypothetical protein